MDNYYRTNLFGNCTPCEKKQGLNCHDDFANLTVGFWWRWKDETHLEQYRNFSKNVKNFSFTPVLHKANDSGIEYPYTIPQPYRCPMAEACKGGLNSSCEAGYEGPLCAVCSDGYHKQLKKCKLCPTKGWMIGQLAIIGALVIIFVILVVWGSKKKSKKDAGRPFLDKLLGEIKVVIGFYQVLYGIMEAFSYIKWPGSLSVVGEYSEIIQMNIVQIAPLHCILPGLKFDAFTSLFAVMGFNIAGVIVALSSLALATWISTRRMTNKEEKRKKKQRIKAIVKRNLFFFLYVTYLNTCLKTAQVVPLACHRICVDEKDAGSCEEYLKADYSIDCQGERYNRLVIVGYCSIVYVIVLPAAAFIAIWKQQRAAKKTEEETKNDTNDFEDQGTEQSGLRFLDETYNSRCSCLHEEKTKNDTNDFEDQGTEQSGLRFLDETYNSRCSCLREEKTKNDTNDFEDQGTEQSGLRFLDETYNSRCSCLREEKTKNDTNDFEDQGTEQSGLRFLDETYNSRCSCLREEKTKNDTNDFEDQGTEQSGLRFLHENYDPRCWYWELVETVRKVILTSGLILLGGESRAYIALALLLSGLYGMYFGLKNPIKDRFENNLMLSSLAVTFVNLAIGAVSTIPSEGYSTSVDPIVDTLVFNGLVFVANTLVIGVLVGKLSSCILFFCPKVPLHLTVRFIP